MKVPAPTSAASTRQSETWRADIQGLRALAVLLVVAYHAGLPVPGGFIGVDVFFVISGFVIGSLLLRELDARGSIDLRRFYTRRAKRLLPALALTVAVTAVGSAFLLSPFGAQRTAGLTGIGAMLLAANVVLFRKSGYFEASSELNPLTHTWSLSVEEQFYLLVPGLVLAAFVLGRASHRERRSVVAAFGVVGLVSFLIASVPAVIGLVGLPNAGQFAFYGSPARAWEFIVGALLAAAFAWYWRARHPTRASTWLGVIGLALIAFAALSLDGMSFSPSWPAAIPVMGTAALLAAGRDASGPLARVLGSGPLVWIGDRSYSWYLWHWPLIVWARLVWPGQTELMLPLAGISALAVAAASYRWFENPIRHGRSIAGRRLLWTIAMAVIIPVLLSSPLAVGLAETPATRAVGAQTEPVHLADTIGCGSLTGGRVGSADCEVGTERPGAPVYLLGDSQASMLSEAVASWAEWKRRPAAFASRGGCAFVDAAHIDAGQTDSACTYFVSRASRLPVDRPGLVIIAISDIYVADPQWAFLNADGSVMRGAEEKLPVYEATLGSLVRRLREAGNQVVLLQAIPKFYRVPGVVNEKKWLLDACLGFVARANPQDCGMSRARSAVEAEQGAVRKATARVATATGARLLDLADALCIADVCATNRGDVWDYRDGTHLSVGATERLAPEIWAALDLAAADQGWAVLRPASAYPLWW